jgi:uncharacterized protein YjbI with pentapeptide repeats
MEVASFEGCYLCMAQLLGANLPRARLRGRG